VFAQILFAFDFTPAWAVQAAGFATAGLVLMVGRFLTTRRKRRPAPPPRKPTPQSATPAGDGFTKWRPLPPPLNGLPSEVTCKVEETWK
jgi:hypothetical protein